MKDEEIPAMLVDAWNRRDIDALLAVAHPEIEYVNAPAAVEPGTRRGHEEVAMVFRKQWEGLVGAVQMLDEVHVRGDEMITIGRIALPMPGSDARIENQFLLAWKVRDGKVSRLAVLGAGTEFAAALEAAGLDD